MTGKMQNVAMQSDKKRYWSSNHDCTRVSESGCALATMVTRASVVQTSLAGKHCVNAMLHTVAGMLAEKKHAPATGNPCHLPAYWHTPIMHMPEPRPKQLHPQLPAGRKTRGGRMQR